MKFYHGAKAKAELITNVDSYSLSYRTKNARIIKMKPDIVYEKAAYKII